jgi:hypothetical protein
MLSYELINICEFNEVDQNTDVVEFICKTYDNYIDIDNHKKIFEKFFVCYYSLNPWVKDILNDIEKGYIYTKILCKMGHNWLDDTGMLSREERFRNFHIFIPMFPIEYMLYKLTTDHNYHNNLFRKLLTKLEYTKYIFMCDLIDTEINAKARRLMSQNSDSDSDSD